VTIVTEAAEPPQTRTQNLVRALGALLFTGMIASVPVVHAVHHWVLGCSEPVIMHSSQVPPPRWSWDSFLEGSYMKSLERYLQEDAPLTWELRTCYNDLRYRAGLLQTERVAVMPGGWMFLRTSLDPDMSAVAARSPTRLATMRRVKAEFDRLGMTLVAMLIPDKERVYPEHAYADGHMPPARARLYDDVLGELRSAGIPTLAVAPVLLAAKAAQPGVLLYCQRDTHWNQLGAAHAALALKAFLEQPQYLTLIGPTTTFGGPLSDERMNVSDLVSMLGLRTRTVRSGGYLVNVPASDLVRDLQEPKAGYALLQSDNQHTLDALMPDARIALAGTSFSGEFGEIAYTFFLRRVIDTRSVQPGSAGFGSLEGVDRRLRAGESKASLVIWEIVERAAVEADWVTGPQFR
jgi:hypothetical protein